MQIILNIVGVLLLLAGGVWFLQGISILPGSFMTGQTRWTVIGGACAVLGLLMLLRANRSRA